MLHISISPLSSGAGLGCGNFIEYATEDPTGSTALVIYCDYSALNCLMIFQSLFIHWILWASYQSQRCFTVVALDDRTICVNVCFTEKWSLFYQSFSLHVNGLHLGLYLHPSFWLEQVKHQPLSGGTWLIPAKGISNMYDRQRANNFLNLCREYWKGAEQRVHSKRGRIIRRWPMSCLIMYI